MLLSWALSLTAFIASSPCGSLLMFSTSCFRSSLARKASRIHGTCSVTARHYRKHRQRHSRSRVQVRKQLDHAQAAFQPEHFTKNSTVSKLIELRSLSPTQYIKTTLVCHGPKRSESEKPDFVMGCKTRIEHERPAIPRGPRHGRR